MDMPTEVWEAIKEGTIYGTVLQDPSEQTLVAIQAIDQYFFGDRDAMTEKFIETDLPEITKANVDTVSPSW